MQASGQTGNERDGGDDAHLLQRICSGDRAAFEALVQRHWSVAWRVAWRVSGGHMDCEDIVQDTFLKLWNNPAQVRDGKALKAWILRGVSNAGIDRLRRKAALALDMAEAVPAPPEQHTPRTSVASAVDEALAHLPERQRQALVLTFFEGLGNIEAASIMEISVEAVESLLGRGKRTLKIALAGQRTALLDDMKDLEP